MKQIRKRLTYANVMSSIAVFLMLGGASAFAATQLGKNSVGTKQLKNNAVTTKKIKKNAVTTAKIRANAVTGAKIAAAAVSGDKIGAGAVSSDKIAAGAVTGDKIRAGAVTGTSVAPASLSTAALSDIRIAPTLKVAATSGTNFESAREAAPARVLFSKGPISVYAKCFTDGSSPRTYAYTYAASTQPGSIFAGGNDSLEGDPFLDPTTPEEDREIYDQSAGENSASGWRSIFTIAAADGTQLVGQVSTFAKNGSLPGGDGIYGAGDACVFNGYALG